LGKKPAGVTEKVSLPSLSSSNGKDAHMSNHSQNKLLRVREVAEKLGISRSTLYDWTNPKSPRFDSTFPPKKRLGRMVVGWMSNEIDAWLEGRNNSCWSTLNFE